MKTALALTCLFWLLTWGSLCSGQTGDAHSPGMAFDITPEPVNTYKAEIEEFTQAIIEDRDPAISGELGLMMIYGFCPGVPVENARAVADSMERYTGFYT